MQSRNEILGTLQDDQKSAEVQEILKGMPSWIQKRGLFTFFAISFLLIMGGIYIRYPETYNTSFYNAKFISSVEQKNLSADIEVEIPLTQISVENHLVILHLGNVKKEMKGKIKKSNSHGDRLSLYIQLNDSIPINTFEYMSTQAAYGRIEIIVGNKNLFKTIFKR